MTSLILPTHPIYGPFLALYENRGSYKGYLYRLRLFQTFLEEKKLSPLAASKMNLLEFNEWVKARNYAPWSVRQNLSVVREFYRYLEATDQILKSPAAILRYARCRAIHCVPRPLHPMDRIALLNGLKLDTSMNFKISLAVRLGMEAGLRVSEMAALPRRAVNFRAETLTVLGKGGVTRTLPVTEVLLEWFSRWFRMAESRWVFFAQRKSKEKHVAERSVGEWMKTAAQWAGIEPFTTHVLRHTFGSILAETGATSHEIKILMGHACVLTSDSYVRLCGNQAQAAHHRAFSSGRRNDGGSFEVHEPARRVG